MALEKYNRSSESFAVKSWSCADDWLFDTFYVSYFVYVWAHFAAKQLFMHCVFIKYVGYLTILHQNHFNRNLNLRSISAFRSVIFKRTGIYF